MVFLQLFYEFFKTGLFSIGGGLATLPFLYSMADRYPWFTREMLLDMIAISESTPGPIGVNMATYAGFNAAGIPGALVATTALVTPSVIVIMIIAKFLNQFSEETLVKDGFYGLRPTVTALIAAAGFQVIVSSLIQLDLYRATKKLADLVDIKALILFGALLFLTNKFKKHPIFYLAGAAVLGIVFRF